MPTSPFLPVRALAFGAAAAAAAAVLAVGTPAAPGAGRTPSVPAGRLPAPVPMAAGATLTAARSTPPTTRWCERAYGLPCYTPVQLRRAYRVGHLWHTGVTGKGATIAIVDSYGSPTIAHDLHMFDRAYGLPDPRLRIVHPAGKVPAYDKHDGEMFGWAMETTLDVEYAHAMAPGAKIILVETPSDETEGVHGFPDMMRSERWLVHHTGTDVISQSFGATEQTFPSHARLRRLRYAFQAAARHRVTVLGASGDLGATDYKLDMRHTYSHRVNSWPSSDPLVTSVGGTQVHLDAKGHRTRPDTVWNDREYGLGASGGGRSVVFDRPAFQNGVRSVTRSHRGTPDISMNAAVTSQVPIYTSFGGTGTGWHLIAGTSEATPLFAGIVALAVDQAGHRLGRINRALYSMRGASADGVVDVVGGSNTYSGVRGYKVTRGYDLGTGWGTVDAATFVPALVKAVAAQRH